MIGGLIEMNEVTLETPTNFVGVLGSSPTNRILDFFIENEREGWAMTEIAEQSRVAYPSVKLVIPKLLEKNVIKIDKKIGKIKLYKINFKNPIAKKLKELRNTINKFEIENYLN